MQVLWGKTAVCYLVVDCDGKVVFVSLRWKERWALAVSKLLEDEDHELGIGRVVPSPSLSGVALWDERWLLTTAKVF